MNLDTSGVPDPTFGVAGLADLSWSASDYANYIGKDVFTKWMLAGSGDVGGDMMPALYRINPDGTGDTTFGIKGRVAMPFADESTGEATDLFVFGTKYFLYGVSRHKSEGHGVSGFG